MNSKDGVPRKAILVMTAILISVILGAQASNRVSNPALGPSTPLASLSVTLPTDTAGRQAAKTSNDKQTNTTKNTPKVVKEAVKNGQLYAASNNRVIHAGGELSSSTTWTNDKLYYINNLIIPSGVTLVIEAGTTIRVEGTNGFIVEGGSIIAQGTDALPVSITSSNGLLGEPGDYGKAVDVRTGAARFNGTHITNATVGVAVEGGSAIIQGSIKGTVSYGVTACNWADIQCAVDASNADITTMGSKACGKVLLGGDTLFVPNCDGTADPLQNLDSSTALFMQSVAPRNDACAAGDMASCDVATNSFSCVSNSLRSISGGLAFVIPDVTNQEDALLFSSRARNNAGSYVVGQVANTSTPPVISSLLTSMVDSFGQLKAVYSSCTPS